MRIFQSFHIVSKIPFATTWGLMQLIFTRTQVNNAFSRGYESDVHHVVTYKVDNHQMFYYCYNTVVVLWAVRLVIMRLFTFIAHLYIQVHEEWKRLIFYRAYLFLALRRLRGPLLKAQSTDTIWVKSSAPFSWLIADCASCFFSYSINA